MSAARLLAALAVVLVAACAPVSRHPPLAERIDALRPIVEQLAAEPRVPSRPTAGPQP